MIRLQDLLTVVENQKEKIDEQVEQINILEAQTGSKSSSLQQLENICKDCINRTNNFRRKETHFVRK